MAHRPQPSLEKMALLFIAFAFFLSGCANIGAHDYGLRNETLTKEGRLELKADLIAAGLDDVVFADDATRRREWAAAAAAWYSEQQEITGGMVIAAFPREMPMSPSSLILMGMAEGCKDDTASMTEHFVGRNGLVFSRVMIVCVPEGQEEEMYMDFIIFDDGGLTQIMFNGSCACTKDSVKNVNDQLLEILGDGVSKPKRSRQQGVVS